MQQSAPNIRVTSIRTALFVAALLPAVYSVVRAQAGTMTGCPTNVPVLEPPTVAFDDAVSLNDVLRVVDSAQPEPRREAGPRSYLEGMWEADSAGVLASLVMLATDPSVANDRQAMTAAWLYRTVSGKAYPVLSNLLIGRDEYRVIGLSAIERLSSPDERKVVALMACQAAWLIRGATEPASYISQLPIELSPTWLWRARDELREAVRLLGSGDPTIQVLRQILGPGEFPADEQSDTEKASPHESPLGPTGTPKTELSDAGRRTGPVERVSYR